MKKKRLSLVVYFFITFTYRVTAQVGINATNIHPSAIFQINSKNKGFLMPRMTTAQRNLITSPAEGLMIYNTDRNAIQFFREIVGLSSILSGWYDIQCNKDIRIELTPSPEGIILDFSKLMSQGLIYPTLTQTTPHTISTSHLADVGLIGPVTQNISSGLGTTDIRYENRNESGFLGSHSIFQFNNTEGSNSYNSATFIKRRIQNNYQNTGVYGDLLTANLTNYSGDFDLILVSRFDINPLFNHEALFSTGGSAGGGLMIGAGTNSDMNCKRNYYNINFAGKDNICGNNTNRVVIDNQFHRFRVKYTDNTTGPNVAGIVEFYIDGVLIERYQNTNINSAKISRLDLFNNRDRTIFSASSIGFLGLYSTHLSDTYFKKLDDYLSCKFEPKL